MKRWLAVLAVLVLCVSCGEQSPEPTRRQPTPSPSPVPTATPEPKRLTICLPDEPESLYIYSTDSQVARHIWQALYDGPTDSRDYGHQPVILTKVPSLGDGAAVQRVRVRSGDRVLAASGSVMRLAPGVTVGDAEDRRTTFRDEPIEMKRMVVTFTLRSDVRWADGEPLTADDSVFAFEIAADPATPSDKQIVERTADYRAVNEHQVVWEGVPGFLDRGYVLNFWHPLPHHAWKGLSAADLLTDEASSRAPLGWGPFSVRDWVCGGGIIMERNPYYFRASEGLPRVDEVTFRFILDPVELTERLLAGTCDVVTHEAVAGMKLDELRASSAIDILTTHASSWELLAFGISPAADYDRADYFEDVRVRQAIARCLDREAIADQARPGGGRVLHSYLPPEHPVHEREGLTEWSFDPEAGKSLLARAGWYDEDGDGVREAHGIPGIGDGTPFRVAYKTTDDPLRRRTAAQVQADLEACGIRVAVEVHPAEVLFAPGPQGHLFGRRFDLAQFSWQATTEPLCDMFLSSQMPGPGDWGRPNVAGFLDGAYDEACRSALQTLPGSADYAPRHAVPQQIFSERLPVLPLYQHEKTALARTSVSGLSPNPSEPSELWNIEAIDVGP